MRLPTNERTDTKSFPEIHTCIRTLSTSVGVVKAAEEAPDNTPKSKFTENDSSRESEISVQGGKND